MQLVYTATGCEMRNIRQMNQDKGGIDSENHTYFVCPYQI